MLFTITELLAEKMKNTKIGILLLIQSVIYIIIISYFDGTGDSGDSIMHYLFAKYSFQHPELFFNHWAKPVYVLLASPFAQFGLYGIKVFNAIVMLLTTLFTFKTTQRLNISHSIIGAIILLFSPLVFVLTFSGLTEPLFALFLIVGIYLMLTNKPIASCVMISFLPFIRSEGLIFLGIFGLYLFLESKWKLIPLLLFGHVVYSLAGFYVHKDILWVFTKIPYAKLSSTYGHGKLFHFVEQMNYVVGVPIYILFMVGMFAIIVDAIKKNITINVLVLIFLGFFSFFIAHTLFWHFGIFNSMGLKRVLIGVAPLSSIISLIGFNYVTGIFQKKPSLKRITQSLLMAYIIIFPFTFNPSAIKWKSDLSLSCDQKLANQATAYITEHNIANRRVFHAHPYLNESLNIDPFDSNKRLELNKDFINQMKSGDIVIWENWDAVVELGITKENLDQNKELINLYNLRATDNGKEILYSIYECK